MMHVKVPERAVSENEPPMVFIETQALLRAAPDSRFAICRDAAPVNRWPVRVTVNLTHILSTIQLR
jgi:hypothetical protein